MRSIMFAFKARGLEIFTDANLTDRFVMTRLVCSDCSAFFHTNLQECYLCGEINYYLLECKDCDTKRSITSGSRMCRICHPDTDITEPETLVYKCVNSKCVSNTDSNAKKEINNSKNEGVFKRNNSWNLSCTFCIECGSPKHEYKNFRVFLYAEPFDKTNYKEFTQNKENDDVIILKKYSSSKIYYDYQIIGGEYTPGSFDKDLDQIVDEILA